MVYCSVLSSSQHRARYPSTLPVVHAILQLFIQSSVISIKTHLYLYATWCLCKHGMYSARPWQHFVIGSAFITVKIDRDLLLQQKNRMSEQPWATLEQNWWITKCYVCAINMHNNDFHLLFLYNLGTMFYQWLQKQKNEKACINKKYHWWYSNYDNKIQYVCMDVTFFLANL